MPDESELRDLFEKSAAPNTIDVDSVVRKARARRVPKQVGAGLVSAFAIAGIFVVAVNTSQLAQQPPSAVTMEQSQDSSGSAAESTESMVKRMSAEQLNPCGAPLTQVEPSFYGLQLDVEFPATAPVGSDVAGVVRLINTSDTRVLGSTAAVPAITVSHNEVSLWHSNGATRLSLVAVDLEPGESIEYAASFTPVLCSAGDDTGDMFPEGLPALPPGDYDLSAVIDFTPDPSMITNGTTELDLVSGPRSPITLG